MFPPDFHDYSYLLELVPNHKVFNVYKDLLELHVYIWESVVEAVGGRVLLVFLSQQRAWDSERIEKYVCFFAWPRSRMTDLKKGLAQLAAKVRRNVYT